MTDQTFSEQEREFLEAFVKILHHLHGRAVKAENTIEAMKHELEVRREQVEYFDKPGFAGLPDHLQPTGGRKSQ